jgi:hypothetical protein
MANPFQRYQSGGFEAVPGITQAGANIGQMLGSGIGNFGANIASGLKQYYENTAKAKAADEDISVVGQQLMSRQQAYMEASGVDQALLQRYLNDDMVEENGDREAFAEIEKNPMVRYAKQLQPVLDSLKSSPSKGLSAKLSALNSAKASFGMIDEQMKLDDFVAKHRLQQTANDLPTSVQVTEDVVTPNVIVDPNNPFFAGVRDLKTQLEQNFPNEPEKVANGIRKYIEKVKAQYGDQDMTPEQKEEFGKSLAAYAEGLRTEVGELTPTGESYEYQDESSRITKLQKEAVAAQKAEKAKPASKDPGMTRAQLSSRKSQLDEQIKTAEAGVKYYDENILSGTKTEYYDMHKKHRDQRAADLEYLKGERAKLDSVEFAPLTEADATARITARATEAKKKPLELKETLNNLGSSILKNVTDDVRQRIAEGERLTLMDIGKQITSLDIELNPTTTSVNVGPYGRGLGVNTRLPSQYTPARDILSAAAKKLGIKGDEPITDEQFLQLHKEMLKGVKTQTDTAAAAATERKGITPEKVAADVAAAAEAKLNPPSQTPAAKSKPFSIGELELGSRLVDYKLNAVEREAAARDFYSKRFGSVPTGFTEMYRTMYPEATVRMTEVNGVPVMVDGKGNITVLKGDAPNVKEMAEAKALTFQGTEIADGVILDGIFAGTVAGAQDFRKNYSHMANVRSAIDELIKINDMGYESMSPTARARADQLQSVIIAALRIPIVGPGAISEKEQEILQRIVEKGTGIFTLEASERAALKGLKDRVDAEIVNWPKSMGLNVRVGGQESDVIKQIRRRRLRTERNLPSS